MFLNYELKPATKKDIPLLKKFKLNTILYKEKDVPPKEKKRILKYVDETTKKYLNKYQTINIPNKIIGSLLIREYEDGIILDEIYIIKEYRYHKIGSSILKELTSSYSKIYLYVYKDNQIALNLYLKYNFKIIEELDTRYLMKYI